MSVVQGAGDPATGDSGAISPRWLRCCYSNCLPVRVIDVVTETKTGADAFVELIVKLNTHQYKHNAWRVRRLANGYFKSATP